MAVKLLIVSILVVFVGCQYNANKGQAVTTNVSGNAAFEDWAKNNDTCLYVAKELLENNNTLLTTEKNAVFPPSRFDTVFYEGNQTIYRQTNEIGGMLIIKEGRTTTTISMMTNDYARFYAIATAMSVVCGDSTLVEFADGKLYTVYIYKDVIAVPWETDGFQQIMFYPKNQFVKH